MNEILLFGAGKSATVLIGYLKTIASRNNWTVVIADADEQAVQTKVGQHPYVKAMGVSITDEPKRMELIRGSRLVISLLPPALHAIVARDCLHLGKHLFTASYVDDTIRAMEKDIHSKGLLFLCEMGLDPGIDHMSAMQIVHHIHAEGGKIHSFHSHCGGLVAPENDNNPWHYKISWNPRNVVLAGKAGAIYREKLKVKSEKYAEIFKNCSEVMIDGLGTLACYPNRDSLAYIPLYGLEETETFIRTTLRYPSYCKGWQYVVDAGLTDEETFIETQELRIKDFLQSQFKKNRLSFAEIPVEQQEQFVFLGWNDDTLIQKGKASPADILQWLIEDKWKLEADDKDMIVMLHEFGYTINGIQKKLKSQLIVKGDDPIHTAMAKTVGLPLGIAATLLLEGKITETGLQIPILPSIYEPVLQRLQDCGIVFYETEN